MRGSYDTNKNGLRQVVPVIGREPLPMKQIAAFIKDHKLTFCSVIQNWRALVETIQRKEDTSLKTLLLIHVFRSAVMEEKCGSCEQLAVQAGLNVVRLLRTRYLSKPSPISIIRLDLNTVRNETAEWLSTSSSAWPKWYLR